MRNDRSDHWTVARFRQRGTIDPDHPGRIAALRARQQEAVDEQ